VALRGDWSRPSADISQFLTARGSAAVPFNQIYGPELPQGQILPALLDREHLLATLSAAKGKEHESYHLLITAVRSGLQLRRPGGRTTIE
ncbi:hypothetical protein PXY50_22415, partial [Acinetobacter baumannii]|nr:hypothetical protein [Acinetobacter baumannii]